MRLAQRQEQVQKQRQEASNRRRNKKFLNYGIILIILAIIVYGSYTYYAKANAPGMYDEFAQCLTTAGVGMYGTDWCPHCQEQKRLFGNSFSKVTYINCDANSVACQSQGVEGYPTWIFADNTRLSGTQPLEVLAEKTGCMLG